MEKKILGLRLLELRQANHLTQKQLCKELNIGRSTYSYFETGSRMPDIDTLLLIAAYYQVSLDELVSGKSPEQASWQEEHQNISLIHHLKAKHIPLDDILSLSKAEFDFLHEYRKLTVENKAELRYIMNYKLRNQTK